MVTLSQPKPIIAQTYPRAYTRGIQLFESDVQYTPTPIREFRFREYPCGAIVVSRANNMSAGVSRPRPSPVSIVPRTRGRFDKHDSIKIVSGRGRLQRSIPSFAHSHLILICPSAIGWTPLYLYVK